MAVSSKLSSDKRQHKSRQFVKVTAIFINKLVKYTCKYSDLGYGDEVGKE